MTERIEFTGKSVDEAIMNAMKHFNTQRENISVRVVEEGSKGIFGFGVKEAKIVAYIKDIIVSDEPKKEAKKPTEKKREPAKPERKKPVPAKKQDNNEKPALKTEEKTEAPVLEKNEPKPREKRVLTDEAAAYGEVASVEFINGLIEKMGVECTVTAERSEEALKLTLRGDGVGALIGRHGDTLDAVQYLTNLYVNKKRKGDDYCRIIIDSETYRAKRQETLQRLANSMASKACKYHKDMSLEPMNPYERRIIHSALQNYQHIKTRSVGEEPNRRVIIMYKK